MTILVIADDEGVVRTVPIARVDALISCGDLPDQVILQVADRVGCSRILAVKRNHDSSGAFDKRITDLHLKTADVNGVKFGGFCGSWKYKPRGNYLFEQAEVTTAFEAFPRVDVFVAHNSPRGVHDKDDDVHFGFSAFAAYIADQRPQVFIHGHQHVNAETFSCGTKVVGVYGHKFMVIAEGAA